MKIAVVDLETYWNVGHSLSKMSPIVYCMHPDTEVISCAVKLGDAETVVAFGEDDVRDLLNSVDWQKYWLVGHNMANFDSMILAWRFGVKPALWGCTLAMARPIHAKDVGLSLAKLVAHYGLGFKDQSVLMQTKGRNLCDFSPQEVADMERYNKADVDQCYELLRRLIKQTRRDEVKLIDMTIRMLVEPQFSADRDLLYNTLEEESVRKKSVLVDAARMLGVDDIGLNNEEIAEKALTVLSSAAKFAEFLRTAGVEVPTKVSPTTGKVIPALAKTDEAFIALREHENPDVATIAEARLDAKSTILQTRIKSFLDAAESAPRGLVPIPLNYYGADTTGRWSGWGYNPQNLPRVNPYNPRPSDSLRKSLVAPDGHKVVVADLSGIELRVNHFLWQVPSSMRMFQDDPEKADLYKDFASRLYDVPFDEVSKEQRQVGKVAHLGLGFGAGYKTFQKVAKLMGGVDIDEEESRDIVNKWRFEYNEIVEGWRTCHKALKTILRGAEGSPVDPWGMVVPTPVGLKTPKGTIRYPDLRVETNEETSRPEYIYGRGRNLARIYAGKIDENIVQHLARCVIADNALTVKSLMGLQPALMVHDELVYVVPEENSQQVLDDVQKIMRTPPDWWPELVTWSEGDIADTYGDAK